MTLTSNLPLHIRNNETALQFLPSGDIFRFTHGPIMINQLSGNTMDGSLNKIYLRVHNGETIKFHPLNGKGSNSTFSTGESKVKWSGEALGVTYELTLHLTEKGLWFWETALNGEGLEADLIYVQDVGIADINALRANEAYVSQYIDHKVFNHEDCGYSVGSRQNQKQGHGFPYLQQGALGKTTGYCTDGFQFYGLSYKETNVPEALTKASLPNETYQYEFSLIALQSEKFQLNGQHSFVFYGGFSDNHEDNVTQPFFTTDEISSAWESARKVSDPFEPVTFEETRPFASAPVFTSESLSADDLDRLYPERILEEYVDGSLYSFFTPSYEHIVLSEKEMKSERSHGHIVMSGNNHQLSGQPVITSTSYMPGVFNAQLVIGNTSMNKLMSNVRNALNVVKSSGQRIYVKLDNQYHLLTMPAVYEAGFNYAKWIYKMDDDLLTIKVWTTKDDKTVTLQAVSEKGRLYDFLVTNQLTMNNNEYDVPYHLQSDQGVLVVKADPSSDSGSVQPDLAYRLSLAGAPLEATEYPEDSLVSFAVEQSGKWTLTVEGTTDGTFKTPAETDFEDEKEAYRTYFTKVMNDFALTHPDQQSVEKVNAISWWYTHNMLVHYSVPHGLEQFGGAAWGTRDVCQGPTEYFMATQQYDNVKEIISTVYSHQYEDNGSWPQWFMFDEYTHIQHDHSHGDVIVWPLKVVADYLTTTGDTEILEMMVPYTDRKTFGFTEPVPLIKHLENQISMMKANFLHDTHLSSYGNGDWDDTLVPANQQLKQYMVSSWTVSLTYQTIRTLTKGLRDARPEEAASLERLADGIEKDFKEYMLNTGTLPGFLYFEDPANPENMVHPDDKKTGINYRLLPMTRSMISELLTPEEVKHHEALIHEHFYCPDGVRLMNRPANYEGGVSKHFMRAEQAANFGREIGLQYVHAHIRFVEAMAKIGRENEVWKGLETINPIGITEAVPNAEIRQSNAYFSSSDGKFNTRYEAQERFNELRTGDVKVKGGWRIYSSGPGIYMNQLISNALGIRPQGDSFIFDPVLPEELDGLALAFRLSDKPVKVHYHIKKDGESRLLVNNQELAASPYSNRYRTSGLVVSKETLNAVLTDRENKIDIYL